MSFDFDGLRTSVEECGDDLSSDEASYLFATIDALRRENAVLTAQLRVLRPAAQRALDELERALEGP